MAEIQEVQTSITTTPENTLETIEAIWTSSRKIIIWRQTRERISLAWESWATLSYYVPDTPIDWYTETEWEGTITNVVWELIYSKSGEWVRLPLEWSYQLTINCFRWSQNPSGTITATTRVLADRKQVYSYDNSANSAHQDTINITVGKFTVIEMDLIYNSTYSATRWNVAQTIVIQKL